MNRGLNLNTLTLSGAHMENFLKNQELSKFMIISFILMTFTFDLRVVVLGEIRSWSFLRVKGLKISYHFENVS